MASPVDAARPTTSISSALTTHAINVGSPSAGDLLIVLWRCAGDPVTVTFTGYTLLTASADDASDDQTNVFYRWADGTEGATDNLTVVNSIKAAAICWRITGAENPATQAPVISSINFGTTANTANPLSITPPGGSKDFLFLALAAMDGELVNFTAPPTNYTNLVTQNSGTAGATASNVIVGGASRQLTAASEDPGAFTHGAPNAGWSAWTVVIYPAAAATPSLVLPYYSIIRKL